MTEQPFQNGSLVLPSMNITVYLSEDEEVLTPSQAAARLESQGRSADHLRILHGLDVSSDPEVGNDL